MKNIIITLLLCLGSITAFSQESKVKDQYDGLSKNAIAEKFGLPTAITKNAGGDGETLFYITRKNNQNVDAPQMVKYYYFTLDKNGVVTAWKEGNLQSKK